MLHSHWPVLQRETGLHKICANALKHVSDLSFNKWLRTVHILCWCLMAITQFPNGSIEFSWIVGVNCPNFNLVWQEMVESIHAWFTWFGLARIDMSELRVDVLHHQCYRFTFDAFFHVSFNNRVVSDNVILKTFGFQYLLPSLLLCGQRHHARLLADFAERVFGVMAKLVSFATGFMF